MGKYFRIRKRWHKCVKDNKGVTMMETVVAFTVLVIILAMIYQMVAFSSSLRMKAADMSHVVQTFNAELYRNGDPSDSGKVLMESYESSTKASDGPLFYFSLNTEKTDYDKNQYSSYEGVTGKNEVVDKNPRNRLKFTQISADCYYFNPDDPLVSDGKLIVPKAIKFIHKKDPLND